MSIVSAGFIVICDICGTDGGSTRPTYEEAREYGADWEDGLPQRVTHTCDECRQGLGTI